MSGYSYKPDISVRLAPRITKQTKRLIDQICQRHEMFESDVLRFCLEAAVSVADKNGLDWMTGQIQGFESKLMASPDAMVTVRTSQMMKGKIGNLTARKVYTENEVVRYCYDYILPIAYRDGFSRIMQMREAGIKN